MPPGHPPRQAPPARRKRQSEGSGGGRWPPWWGAGRGGPEGREPPRQGQFNRWVRHPTGSFVGLEKPAARTCIRVSSSQGSERFSRPSGRLWNGPQESCTVRRPAEPQEQNPNRNGALAAALAALPRAPPPPPPPHRGGYRPPGPPPKSASGARAGGAFRG
eukprot:8103223-Alexandrium_andersonii.AAC.1